VTAASQIGGDVHVLVAGSGAGDVAAAASKVAGVAKVLHAEGDHFKDGVSVEISNLIGSLADGYDHILASASTSGKDLLPRVAIATVQSSDAKKLLTVRATAFDAADAQAGSAAVESVDAGAAVGSTSVAGRELTASERPELTAADIVVSGGRGVGSAENFSLIESLADKLGAAVGASRAAVDAGYMPNDYQVGQTGKIVAPSLYIAVGISGAIQHLAGMKDSKVIVAINKDEEAPIFQ